jgi:hypothetical protein
MLEVKVYFNMLGIDNSEQQLIKQYKKWFIERNIKYDFHYRIGWGIIPEYVFLSAEDALAFKLAFGL